MKKVVSVLLVLIVLISTFPITMATAVSASSQGIYNRITEIKNVYPSGSYFTVSGNLYPYRDGYDCQLSNIPARGGLSTGAKAANICGDAWSCCGFARYVFYNIFYHAPELSDYSTKVSIDNAKPGDFVVFSGHYGIFIEADSSSVYVYDSNYTTDPTNIVGWKTKISRSQVSHIWHSKQYSSYNDKYSGVHVHDYVGEGYEQAHPHKVYRICDCGAWEYVEDQYKTLNTCVECNPTTLKVYYNANGGSISSDTYKLSSDLVYIKADSTKYFQKWTYDKTKEDGLINYSSFGLYKKGYTFAGWGTEASGGTVFSQSDSTLKPTDINPDLKKGDCATILYAQWEPNVLSVKFNANGGSISSDTYWLNSDLVYNTADSSRYYQSWTYNNTKADGLINYSTFGLYKKGYTFSGWGTKASGGTVFSQSDSTLKPTDINPELENGSCTATLYAQWAENVLTVNYNINGGTIDSDKYKLNSGILSYASNGEKVNDLWAYNNAPANGLYNPGTFGIYKTGYTFAGWGTKASGGTVFHQDDTTLKASDINADIKTGNCSSTLYAQWAENILTVNYNINGGSINSDKYTLDSGILSYSSNGEKVNDLWSYNNAPANGLYNPGTFGIYKTGYTFAGWGTKASGGTVFHQDDTTLKASDINASVNKGNCTIELYAQWEPITYKISFAANGGSVDSSSVVVPYGDSVKLPTPSKTYTITYNTNGGSGTPAAQTAFVECLGWSMNSNASTADYLCGASYTPAADSTFYAVWNQYSSKLLSSTNPTRIGYTFLGWSQSSTATTATFSPGEKITLSGDITLYAVWQKLDNSTDTTEIIYKTVHLDYKEEYQIKTNDFEAGRFIVEKDSTVLKVDSDGTVNALTVGNSTVYVYDSDNNLRAVYTFEVDYAAWQRLIIIFLFGWIWYI